MSIYSRSFAFLVILLSFAVANLSGCSTGQQKRTESSTPVTFKETSAVKNYVSLDLAYPYYKMVFDKLETRLKTPLKNRGEAHITLVTPPEFKILATKISPKRIHELANQFMATNPPIQNMCVGHFEKKLTSQLEHVYYVVIEAPELVEFRKQLALESGLEKNAFDPELFFPHVTIGFTDRDMHYEDGAIKSPQSCPDNLKAVLRER